MGYFPCREIMECLLCLRHQFLKVKVREDKRLEMNIKVLFGRKNEVVGELDFALKVLAAAFGIELDFMLLCETGLVFMLMVEAMRTRLRCIDEATRQVMLRRAIVEFHVPTD